eukprot:gene16534-biopygen5273
MGPEVGPAFQRRSRATLKFILGARLAETVEVRQYKKRKAYFLAVWSWIHIQNPRFLEVFAFFAIFVTTASYSERSLAFAPRRKPPRARAPGAQMIWMTSGSTERVNEFV